MAQVQNVLEIWQGCQNLCATQKESCTQHHQLTAIEYISDTEEMVKAFWSKFQHERATAFKLSERSPLPPALPAKDLPEGTTPVLNFRQIKRIDPYPAESDEDSASESIFDTKNLLDWDGDLDYRNESEDDWETDNESHIEKDYGIDDPESPAQWDISDPPIVSKLVWPKWRSKKKA